MTSSSETSSQTCRNLSDHVRGLSERYNMLAPPHCRLALLDVRLLFPLIEQPDTLPRLLSSAENKLFRQFRIAKRRLEWLGGRLAAKCCLHQLLSRAPSSLPFHQYSILPNTHGAPRLEWAAGRPDMVLSISHSCGYAAALACQAENGNCGIDIQYLTPTLAKVAEQFTRKEELDLIDPLTAPLTRLGLIWTAKEAVKKCLLANQSSFFGRIQLAWIEYDRNLSLWTAQCRISQPADMVATVRIAGMDDHMIACATGDAHA
jgi:Phosphopantetheinyl transferase